MKLQLALDLVDKAGVLSEAKEFSQYVDIIEVGTPIIINEGLHAVKALAESQPNTTVLADLKVMDAGSYEVSVAAAAGAKIVTILAAAEDSTIKGAVEEAKKHGVEILVDMIAIKDLAGRAKELDAMGVDYICVHTGYDGQAHGESPLEALKTVKANVKNAKTAVAGGIKLDTVEAVIAAGPDLVIVGGGITQVEGDRVEVAKKFRELVK